MHVDASETMKSKGMFALFEFVPLSFASSSGRNVIAVLMCRGCVSVKLPSLASVQQDFLFISFMNMRNLVYEQCSQNSWS